MTPILLNLVVPGSGTIADAYGNASAIAFGMSHLIEYYKTPSTSR